MVAECRRRQRLKLLIKLFVKPTAVGGTDTTQCVLLFELHTQVGDDGVGNFDRMVHHFQLKETV